MSNKARRPTSPRKRGEVAALQVCAVSRSASILRPAIRAGYRTDQPTVFQLCAPFRFDAPAPVSTGAGQPGVSAMTTKCDAVSLALATYERPVRENVWTTDRVVPARCGPISPLVERDDGMPPFSVPSDAGARRHA